MQKQSRLPHIATASSILLPFGFVTTSTMIETSNQFWLFPLWTYVHDFGNWFGFGVIIPPFSPLFPLLWSILGLIWCVLGLSISKALHQFYASQRDAKSVWLPTIRLLVLQIIVTIIVNFITWYGWLIVVVPLPLHFLIVLYLLRIQTQRVEQERVSRFQSYMQAHHT